MNQFFYILSQTCTSIQGCTEGIEGSRTPILQFVMSSFEFAYQIAGVICIALLIYGGFLYIMSSGDDNQVKTATKTMTNAIIGIVIVLSAVAIYNTFKDKVIGYTPDSTNTQKVQVDSPTKP